MDQRKIKMDNNTYKNILKKAIYKANPKAKLDYIRIGNAYYSVDLHNLVNEEDKNVIARFCVPITDMGSTDFYPVMQAKFLLRWLDVPIWPINFGEVAQR